METLIECADCKNLFLNIKNLKELETRPIFFLTVLTVKSHERGYCTFVKGRGVKEVVYRVSEC